MWMQRYDAGWRGVTYEDDFGRLDWVRAGECELQSVCGVRVQWVWCWYVDVYDPGLQVVGAYEG